MCAQPPQSGMTSPSSMCSVSLGWAFMNALLACALSHTGRLVRPLQRTSVHTHTQTNTCEFDALLCSVSVCVSLIALGPLWFWGASSCAR